MHTKYRSPAASVAWSAARPALAIVVFGLLAICTGCGGSGGPEHGFGSRGPVPVLVAKAVKRTVAKRLKANGRVEAYSTVQVKAQVSGQVLEVHFQRGEDVTAGQLLFTIDPAPFTAALRQSEADLARDRAAMVQAEADFHRFEYLLKTGVGSRQQYDAALSKYDSLKATVAADQARIQTAQLNLGYCRITSPIDGRTGDLLLHPGNLVEANADTAMVVINQTKPVYVDFNLPEQELPTVREAMSERSLPVQAAVPGVQETVTGTLSFVDNTVDPSTGTIALKGLFPNRDERLWPGQFVETQLTVAELPDAILVPSQAVQIGQDGSYVFVVGPGMKADIRNVATGETIEGDTVIQSGLKAGEMVVTDGQMRLIPGGTVVIKSGLNVTHNAS